MKVSIQIQLLSLHGSCISGCNDGCDNCCCYSVRWRRGLWKAGVCVSERAVRPFEVDFSGKGAAISFVSTIHQSSLGLSKKSVSLSCAQKPYTSGREVALGNAEFSLTEALLLCGARNQWCRPLEQVIPMLSCDRRVASLKCTVMFSIVGMPQTQDPLFLPESPRKGLLQLDLLKPLTPNEPQRLAIQSQSPPMTSSEWAGTSTCDGTGSRPGG